MRQALLAVQVATSCVLLIVANLLARNAIRGSSISVRFDYQHMVIADPQLYEHNLTPPVERQRLDALTTRLMQLPGVDGVTAAVIPPLGYRRWVEHLPGLPLLSLNSVPSSYFKVMGLAVLRGGTFRAGEQDAAVVSESAARAIWPNQNPIGKVWQLEGRSRTVAGVVEDSGANDLTDPGSVEAYLPIADQQVKEAMLILHARGDPALLGRNVQSIASLPGEPVSSRLMRARLDNMAEALRKMITIISALGISASLLAAIGIFGLAAFTVAQRTREIGIRMAVGARPANVLAALLSQNAAPVAIGAVTGVILAALAGRLMRAAFYGLMPLDPTGYVIGLLSFAVITALATLSPALRALRIDPASILRYE
jgi:hypothetical protein